MSFLVYFAVLVVAAASAIFGLDLVSSPLPTSPTKVAVSQRTEPRNVLEKRQADAKTAQAGNPNRPLSPVYPASPTAPSADVRVIYPPTNVPTSNATTAAENRKRAAPMTPSAPSANAPQQQPLQQQAAQTVEPTQSPATTENQNTTTQNRNDVLANTSVAPSDGSDNAMAASNAPAPEQGANRCDVQACSSAYRSFRASDCTYQPLNGPRRLCHRTVARWHPGRGGADLDRYAGDVERTYGPPGVARRAWPPMNRYSYDNDFEDGMWPPARGRGLFPFGFGFGWR